MFTTHHPQTDGQTERVNCALKDILRSVCDDTPKRWNYMLPIAEFALNYFVHASTDYTPLYVNGLCPLRVPLMLPRDGSGLGGEEVADRLADISSASVKKQAIEFLATRLDVLRHVRDAMADS